MSRLSEHVDIDVPARAAYDRWTQFEDFPRFMEGVAEVRRLDDTRLRFKTRIAGVERDFDTEITEQHPDQRIAWRAPDAAGVVTFDRLGAERTRITVHMDAEPRAPAAVRRRLRGDLARFKQLIEGPLAHGA